MWNIDSEIAQEMYQNGVSRGCPLGQTYVPESLQLRVIEWAHAPMLGIAQTLSILVRKYWWPRMAAKVKAAGK